MITPQETNPEYPVKGIAAASSIYGNLLQAATSNTAGDWMDVRPCSRFSIEITGSASGVNVQLYGSLAEAPPITVGGVPGSAIGSAITAKGITYVTMPLRFIRAASGTISGGTVNVTVQAVAP